MAKSGFKTLVDAEVKNYVKPEDYKAPALGQKLNRKQINGLTDSVLMFAEALCGVDLRPYQRDFAHRVILSVINNDGEEITGLFSRQGGKTEAVAVLVCGIIVMLPAIAQYIHDPRIQKFKKGVWVGLFAPTHEQADTLHDRMLEKMNSDHAREILSDDSIGIDLGDDNVTNLFLPNGSIVRTHSAARQARIEGKTYHLLVSDESQDIDPFVYRKSISPMGSAVNASQIKIGTCNLLKSDFYEACQRNSKRQLEGKGDKLHFQYDYEVVSKYNPFYKTYVAKEITRMGFDSDEFRMAYRLHWILERGMFIDPALFLSLGKNYSPITVDYFNDVFVGIDIGKIGSSTIVTAIQADFDKGEKYGEDDHRSHKRILNWLELSGDNYEFQFMQIIRFLENYRKLKRVMIDATGVGQHMYDKLKIHYAKQIEEGQFELIEFIAGTQTNNDGYSRLLLDLQNDRVEYPNSERAKRFQKQRNFVLQLGDLRKHYVGGGYLSATEGDSAGRKDYASSLMLGCWCCDFVTEFGGKIETDQNNVFFQRRVEFQKQWGRSRPSWNQ